MAHPSPPPESRPHTTPRWVKVSGIIAIALALVVAAVLLIGGPEGHGPGRHLPGGGAPPTQQAPGGGPPAGHTPPPGIDHGP